MATQAQPRKEENKKTPGKKENQVQRKQSDSKMKENKK